MRLYTCCPRSLGQYHSCNLSQLLGEFVAPSNRSASEGFYKHNINLYHHRYTFIYSWVKRNNVQLCVLLKDASTMVAARIRTHILMNRPSKHKSDALWTSAVLPLTCVWHWYLQMIPGYGSFMKQTGMADSRQKERIDEMTNQMIKFIEAEHWLMGMEVC